MKFITVHNGKKEEERIADILNASISKVDDIDTAVWTEKHYIDNKPQINSDQYFVFVGKTSTSENIKTSPEFEVKFKELNMSYGYLGRQAVFSVDKNFKWNDSNLNQFVELHNKTFESEIKKGQKEEQKKRSRNRFKGLLTDIDEKMKSIPLVGKIAAVPVGLLLFGVFGNIIAVTSGAYIIKGNIDNKKIIKDAWNIVSSNFIKNKLSDFLGIEDE